MKDFLHISEQLKELKEIERLLSMEKGPLQFSIGTSSAFAQITSGIQKNKTKLLVTSDETEARKYMDDLSFFREDVLFFPEKDFLFYQADMRSLELTKERMKVLRLLFEKKDVTIVTTIGALMNDMAPLEELEKKIFSFKVGESKNFNELSSRFILSGYHHVPRVEEPGEFSVRGGILDIFDITMNYPVRIEFFDDEIDTIRSFDISTQRSIETLEEIQIYPATELFVSSEILEEGKKRIFDDAKVNDDLLERLKDIFKNLSDVPMFEKYLPYFYEERNNFLSFLPPDTVVFLKDEDHLKDRSRKLEEEFKTSIQNRIKKYSAIPKEEEILFSFEEVMNCLPLGRTVYFSALDKWNSGVPKENIFRFAVEPMISYAMNYTGLLQDLKRYQKEQNRILILVPSRTRARRMADELRSQNLNVVFLENENYQVLPGQILVTVGFLSQGFRFPDLKTLLITENDLYSRTKKARRKKKVDNAEKISNFTDLRPGDYVVHETYGIGIYKGLTTLEISSIEQDFMEISYEKSGKIFVPLTSMDVVHKYASASGIPPRVTNLNSAEWCRTKMKVRKSVTEVADDLMLLYEKRMTGKGHAYGKDTLWQSEFEECFPYEETADQLKAIAATKKDMEDGKIMDRLIAGDVGFGKTEVALRAAFKAVQDGKQVAYLVPTTLLADQHFKTFSERLSSFPVKTALLSRFRTPSEIKKTLADLKEGKVDILIGTHRILSKDVNFKNLGLLLIDEEQRFGVRHKEKIKVMKNDVDVLTLTATPIPRTLHMSMIGVRDISTLTEPPEDRLPIQTYVMEYSEELIREAITREISRDGQVYYVYNRVRDIEEVASKVQKLVPDARVSFAHGKMSEVELENRMMSFIQGEIDVLVSTTIIETGLDIPNVNTIIIHDGERYGLSQLYQLRGRVGRCNRQAFAFVLYQKDRVLNEDAEKRLAAIREHTALGSGMKIAMTDLSIRGAGAVLGTEQSGHMMAVGYDLYCKMLKDAVERAKRKARGEKDYYDDLPETNIFDENVVEDRSFDTKIQIHLPISIPGDYIENEMEKMEMYKRIAMLETSEERIDLLDELIDRFGDPPEDVLDLMEIALIRHHAKRLFITEISGNTKEVTLKFVPFAEIRADKIPEFLEKERGEFRFLPGKNPGFLWQKRNLADKTPKKITELLNELLDKIEKELF